MLENDATVVMKIFTVIQPFLVVNVLSASATRIPMWLCPAVVTAKLANVSNVCINLPDFIANFANLDFMAMHWNTRVHNAFAMNWALILDLLSVTIPLVSALVCPALKVNLVTSVPLITGIWPVKKDARLVIAIHKELTR